MLLKDIFKVFYKKEEPTKLELFYNKCNNIHHMYCNVLDSKHLQVKGSERSGNNSAIRLATEQGDRLFEVTKYYNTVHITMLNPYIKGGRRKSILFDINTHNNSYPHQDYGMEVFHSIDIDSDRYIMSLEEIELALYELEHLLTPLYNKHLEHELVHNTKQKLYFS